MRVACSIHGLRPAVKGIPKTVAALVPGTGELALAGEGALLQIFHAIRNRHVDKVQVRHSPQVSSLSTTVSRQALHLYRDCKALRAKALTWKYEEAARDAADEQTLLKSQTLFLAMATNAIVRPEKGP